MSGSVRCSLWTSFVSSLGLSALEFSAAEAIARLYSPNRFNQQSTTTNKPTLSLATSTQVGTSLTTLGVPDQLAASLPQAPAVRDHSPLSSMTSSGKQVGSAPRYPRACDLYRSRPQLLATSYRAEAIFSYALVFLVRDEWCNDEDLSALSAVHPDYDALIRCVPEMQVLDFSSLREPLADYESHTTVSKGRVRLFAACAIYYGLDFGLVVRYLDGEFTAAHRDVSAILKCAEPFVQPGTLSNMSRILTHGSPAHLNWFEPHTNKHAFVRRGNHPAVRQHQQIVDKTLAKEVRYSHLIPLPRWMCTCSAYGHHVPQNILIKPGKKPRLIWDGKTKKFYYEITTNEMTGTELEENILFGTVFMSFCIWIYNLRISYPDEIIYLAFLDISACFRFPRIAPDLVGAFGFIVGPLYYLANAMVFGSIALASSWEPFRLAIAAIATSLFTCVGLLARHEVLLRRVRWAPRLAGPVRLVRASPCSWNTGVFRLDGLRLPTPHCIYVDDDLLAEVEAFLPQALACAAEAIFRIMGRPLPIIRPSPLAMDKFDELVVASHQVLLGFEFDTCRMHVSLPPVFHEEVVALLSSHWHAGRKSFTVHELELLVGKLGRIAQAYRPMYYLMSHLYSSVAFALRENASFLVSSSRSFRELIRRVKSGRHSDTVTSDDKRIVDFALSQAARRLHGCAEVYRIPRSLRDELDLILALLSDPSIELCTPLAHVVPRDPTFVAAADSCKYSGGGYSADLRFMWYLRYPDEVVSRALLPNNKSGKYISINCLEMLCIVVNFSACIYACWYDGVDMSCFPVLLNWCDNVSAGSWVNTRCKSSLLGRALGRLFCGLLMGSPLAIQAEWLATSLNVVADDISRLKTNENVVVDYSEVLLSHPVLHSCRIFQPSDFLLTTLWDLLLNSASPDPLAVARLAPETLGSFISLDS